MSKPVDVGTARPQGDGAGFLDCPTCMRESGTDWIVRCRFSVAKPVISALICAECGTEIVVEFGEIAGFGTHDH